MKKILFISEKHVIAESIIESNIDAKVLSKVILLVQTTELKQVLGVDLYENLLSEIEKTATINGYAITGVLKGLMDTIRPYLIYSVLEYFAGINQVKISNKGGMRYNDNSATASSNQELETVIHFYKNAKEQYKLDLVNFLKINKLIPDSISTDTDVASDALGWFLESPMDIRGYDAFGGSGGYSEYGGLKPYSGSTGSTSGTTSGTTGGGSYITGFTETDPLWLSEKGSYLTIVSGDSRYMPLSGVSSNKKEYVFAVSFDGTAGKGLEGSITIPNFPVEDGWAAEEVIIDVCPGLMYDNDPHFTLGYGPTLEAVINAVSGNISNLVGNVTTKIEISNFSKSNQNSYFLLFNLANGNIAFGKITVIVRMVKLMPSSEYIFYVAPTQYGNDGYIQPFTKNNCGVGFSGSTENYNVAPNQYFSTISVADANTQAINDINTNGQSYVNSIGSCVAVPVTRVLLQGGNTIQTATLISGQTGHISGSSINAGTEADGLANSVWYKWTAPSANEVTFNSFTTPYDTILHVGYANPDGSNYVLVGVNDDWPNPSGTGPTWNSEITITPVQGVTYFVELSGFAGSDAGNFQFNWSQA